VTLNTAHLETVLGAANMTNLAAPVFIIAGDGGAATYQCQVDGTDIGQYRTSSVYGDVRVVTPWPLGDGPHRLTFQELSPHAGLATFPFDFTVDTVAPPVPAITRVEVGTTPIPNDPYGRIMFPVTAYGTASPNARIRIFNGPTGLGGGVAYPDGTWRAATSGLPQGSYSLTAVASDTAGNSSARSAGWPVTVGTAPPPPPPPPPATVPGTPVAGTGTSHPVTLQWTTPPDGGASIGYYLVTYTVRAVNSVGDSQPSLAASVQVAP
jgi:hypothetical protein